MRWDGNHESALKQSSRDCFQKEVVLKAIKCHGYVMFDEETWRLLKNLSESVHGNGGGRIQTAWDLGMNQKKRSGNHKFVF